MTIAELIKELERHNPEAVVKICFGNLCDSEHKEMNKHMLEFFAAKHFPTVKKDEFVIFVGDPIILDTF